MAAPAISSNPAALHAATRHRRFHWNPQAISSAAGRPIHTACCVFDVTNSSAARTNTHSGAARGEMENAASELRSDGQADPEGTPLSHWAVIHTAAAVIRSNPQSAAASIKNEFR